MRVSNQNSIEFCQSVRHYMSVLLEQKNYTDTVRYYESHRNELDTIGGVQAGMIKHLASRAYASLTHYPIALQTARMAQNLIALDGDSLLLAEVFLTIGNILRDMG